MALNVYSPPETAVIHKTTVDIGNIRPMAQVVKLTQGDKSLPLIAVKLLNSGQPYEVPESATDAVFNFRKGDRKAVINSALGVSSDRQTVYVEATEQTCASAGRGEAIVQIQVGEQVAGTGIFCIDVTPNPTTDASLSDTEIGVLQGLVDEANDAKADAQQSASEASQSASDAQESAGEASDSATLAGQHKDDAESAKSSAEQFANTAEQEATNAENARDQAEVYMEKAQASSAVSNSSYYIGDDGMLHLKFDSDGLGQKDIDQTLSELQSDVAELQSDIDQDRDMLNTHTTQISQANTEIEALETELDTVALRQFNYGNAQVGGTSLGITSTKLLEVAIPQTYRGKRVILELIGLCVQVTTGMASIEIKKVNGGQDVNPPVFSVDITSGNPAVISRVTLVRTDSNTEAFRVYGYVGTTSASAKIANGNTFVLKVSCMAS